MEQAARQNFFFGAKLVRGAYMEQERARAEQLGYEDPINPDFEATSASYHRCLAECMRRMHELKTQDMPQKVGIMVASHNADTIRFALTRYAKPFFSTHRARSRCEDLRACNRIISPHFAF